MSSPYEGFLKAENMRNGFTLSLVSIPAYLNKFFFNNNSYKNKSNWRIRVLLDILSYTNTLLKIQVF